MCPQLGSLALVKPGNIIKEPGCVQVYAYDVLSHFIYMTTTIYNFLENAFEKRSDLIRGSVLFPNYCSLWSLPPELWYLLPREEGFKQINLEKELYYFSTETW